MGFPRREKGRPERRDLDATAQTADSAAVVAVAAAVTP